MRRREAGRGAVPAGSVATEPPGRRRGSARVHYEIPPGAGLEFPISTLIGDEARPAAVHHREETCATASLLMRIF